MSEIHYKAFISYSHLDTRWAIWLHKSLEKYRIESKLVQELQLTSKRLYPVFRDRSEFGTASSLPKAIKSALQKSEYLIVVCSPAAAKSTWVNEEANEFIRLGRRDKIICILVDGDGTSDCFPACLANDEPLAADPRNSADGKLNALLRVISGILEIPFDRLGKRELRRRRHELIVVASVATVIVTLTSSLAIYAWFARQEAEQRLLQSEGLIGFMLQDLRGRLEPMGKLDVLDAVGDKATGYYATLDLEDVTISTLVTHAIALRQIGEVRSTQGHHTTALGVYQESLTLLQVANERDDQNLDVLYQIAQTRFGIADIYYQRLDYRKAQEEIKQYRDLAIKMVGLDPFNTDHQMEVAFAENNLGTLAFRAGESITARQHFMAALKVKQGLSESDAENLKLQVEIADTMSWIRSVESNLGNISKAVEWHRRQVSMMAEILLQETDVRYRDKLGLAYRKLSEDLFNANRINLAAEEGSNAVSIYRKLVDHDEENAIWRGELYTCLLNQVRVQLTQGELAEVDTLLLKVSDGLDYELSINPNSGRLQRERATADIYWARYNLALKQPAEAHALKAVGRLRQQLRDSSDIDAFQEFARATYVLASVYKQIPMPVEDDFMTNKVLPITSEGLQALNEIRKGETETIALQALLLASAGRGSEAQKFIDQVLDTEYRAPEYLNGSPLGTMLYGAK